MNKNLFQRIDASIQLEHNIARIYSRFRNLFPRHAAFWDKLVSEELNHAALISSSKDFTGLEDAYPDSILANNLTEVEQANKMTESQLDTFHHHPPSEKDAFNLALELEQSATEIHFQHFMEKQAETTLEKIFQKLNQDDKDHSKKIRSYMQKCNIPIKEHLQS